MINKIVLLFYIFILFSCVPINPRNNDNNGDSDAKYGETIQDTGGSDITKTINFKNIQNYQIKVDINFSSSSVSAQSITIFGNSSKSITVTFKSGSNNTNILNMFYKSKPISASISYSEQEFQYILTSAGSNAINIDIRIF